MSNSKEISSNFIHGGKAGFLAGLLVAPFEFLKVLKQANNQSKLRGLVFQRDFLSKTSRSILPFSSFFSLVCAVEFSINEFINKRYGFLPGLGASSLSGALLLTAADHLMFRQEKKQSVAQALRELAGRKLFVGLTPMIFREGIFITSVMYIGPFLGSLFSSSKTTVYEAHFYNFFGTLSSGFVTTLLSQPFDSFARQLQISHHEKKGQGSLDCLLELQRMHKASGKSLFEHPLLAGAIPRMVLASFGGALAREFYYYFKEKSTKEDHKGY